jgi:hypothetical protein
MRTLFLILLLCLLPVVVVVQDFLPILPPAQERIQLLPVLFCFGALALPFIPALFFALATALIQGLILLQFQSGQAENGLAPAIVFFLCWTIALQMTGEITHGLRWELHALGSFLVTITMLGGEFLMICAKRGGLPLSIDVLTRVAVPSGASLLLAPMLYLLLKSFVPITSEGSSANNPVPYDL